MLTFAYVLAGVLMLLSCMMAYLAARFIFFYNGNLEEVETHEQPKVGIILPLRGSDPFLKRCLVALLDQDYPDYVIRIIVDNPDDPARAEIEEVLQAHPADIVSLEFLEDFTDTCSLRSCALRQAYRGLPDDCEVIIQVDADAYPYPGWIQDLVDGLREPDVGVACGVRWFSPPKPSIPNLARHIWNAGAILQMQPMNIGWGGSFAIKKTVFEQAQLYDHWGSALFDDTYSTDLILQAGYRLKVLPRVTMVNEESTNWKGCFIFVTRQLLNLRLYHRAWRWVRGYGLTAFLVAIISFVFGVVALTMGERETAAIVLGSLALYYLFQTFCACWGERIFNNACLKLGRPAVKVHNPLWVCVGVISALIVYPLCLIEAQRTKSVTWRGITYEFTGPNNVKRLNYEPYVPEDATANLSL